MRVNDGPGRVASALDWLFPQDGMGSRDLFAARVWLAAVAGGVVIDAVVTVVTRIW